MMCYSNTMMTQVTKTMVGGSMAIQGVVTIARFSVAISLEGRIIII